MQNEPSAPVEAREDWDNIDMSNDHASAGDDSEMQLEPDVTLGGDEAGHPEGADADHPANPATYPIPPKPKLSEFVTLTEHELAEKGKALAKEYVEIETLKKERAKLGTQIRTKEETIGGLVVAITTGQVEVPVGQEDLFRQPMGAQAAARAFEEMAASAKAAGQEGIAEGAQDAAKAEAELNAMAADIQAGQGIDAPGPGFLNDIENHKAKSAAKRKGKK